MKSLFASLIFAVLSCASSMAQDYPSRPVRIVNPYPPGGAADAVARLLAQALADRLGGAFIVENLAGAGGSIGTAQVARGDADGHTILFANTGNLSINPWLYRNLGYDPAKAFAPLAMVGTTDLVAIVPPSSPFRTISDLIGKAKAEPGSIRCAQAGSGTINHLTLAMFKAATGVDCLEVPFRGAAPAVNDIVGGHVDLFFATIASVVGQIEGGAARPLAVTSLSRSARLPSVPTLDESGVKGFEASLWLGVALRSGTSVPVAAKLEDAIRVTLADAAFRQKLTGIVVEPRFMSSADFGRFLTVDRERWRKAVEQAAIAPQ
ncbi:MAG: tripartite tricarboxylate transporter substrate binding protein [Beijerinckiaceae bacterium]|nr:tripartite tricarboxylate transporter substrate binding protein [Beijerinckiaceae bacterium]